MNNNKEEKGFTRVRNVLLFSAQAVIVGMAIAFVIIVFWPQLIPQRAIEIRQAQPETAGGPAPGPVSYAAAVGKAAPAVVNVNTAKIVTFRPNPFFDDPLFRQFFGGNLAPQRRLETSLGSGVIISAPGYILTNYHVVDGADAIQVSLRDGRTASAKVIGGDPEADIAVLKINLPQLPVITLGQSDQLHVGDVVLAIGNPFGVGQTVTMGIVSATGRNQLGINTFENFIQTDAAINPGNSGGALIDANGNLIGINTAIFTRSGGNQGIGFAIPTSLAKEVMEQIIKYGHAVRGWLGIEAQTITPELAQALKLKENQGVIVAGVVRGGPAQKAGLRPGDILVSLDSEKITDAHEALILISKRKPGTQVKLNILRDGKSMTLEATTVDRPARALQLQQEQQ
ncbi:MAG TPA: Do family serine endopeptidase [Acidiferrobacterales bacterium]|nr:Do family serine endopeptidase [Acidiferrobacterales bacterium]